MSFNPDRSKSISRRQLIGLSREPHNPKERKLVEADVTIVPEVIDHNNTRLTLIPVEHSLLHLPKVLPQITKLCLPTDKTIVEYYPEEIINSGPEVIRDRLTNAEEIIPWFQTVISDQPDKEILRLDPAYCQEFGLLRLYAAGVPVGLSYPFAKLGSYLIKDKVTRRKFIKLAGIVGTLAGLVAFLGEDAELSFEQSGNTVSPFYAEPDFRRAVFVKLLNSLTANPTDQGKNYAIIYPPFHLNHPNNPRSIKSLLTNPNQVEDILNFYSWLNAVPEVRNKLFTGAEYSKAVNSKRQLQRTIK